MTSQEKKSCYLLLMSPKKRKPLRTYIQFIELEERKVVLWLRSYMISFRTLSGTSGGSKLKGLPVISVPSVLHLLLSPGSFEH